MKIQLKVRKEEAVIKLPYDITFKIPESSFIFMRLDVSGLAVRPKCPPGAEPEESEVIKVLIPDEKVPVVCLSTGKAQWLRANEKVQIVELEAKEIFREEE